LFGTTDASISGLGPVLFQLDKLNKAQFISFQNRALSVSERNYSATKRELLAIIFALKKFHHYLFLNPFTLYTDHKALTYIFLQKHTNPLILGWFETLLSYSFTIKHNLVSKTLSLIICQEYVPLQVYLLD
jgi:hypothetical protein